MMKSKTKALMMFSLIAGMAGHGKKFHKDKLEGIDVEKEYELIKQKKSKLSANMRRIVTYRYEKKINSQ